MRYSEALVYLTGDVGQRVWSKEDFDSQGSGDQDFKKLLVKSFYWKYDSVLYTLNYHLVNQKMEDTQSLRTIPVLDSGPYKYLNAYINQAFKIDSQRKRKRMRKVINVLKRRYERALPHGKMKIKEAVTE